MNRVDRQNNVAEAFKGNTLDKVISYFNPILGAKRANARAFMALSGSYIGASKSRRQTSQWNPLAGSADDDSLDDLNSLRDRSRWLVRNESLAVGAINTVTTNVIGSGLRVKPTIDAAALGISPDEADALEAVIKREFNLWAEAKTADVARTLNFYAQQEQAFRAVLESGDVIAIMAMVEREMNPYKLAIQIIEADRLSNPDNAIDTPTLIAGVEKDTKGAPVAYHIANQYPNSYSNRQPKGTKWNRITAYGAESGRQNIIHLFTQLRPGQTRGIPYLAAVIEPLKMIGKYTEAELISAVISGMFTVFVKTADGEGLDFSTDMGAETGSKSSDKDIKMASGAIVDIGPDDEIESANPGRPNTAFDPFVQAIFRQIGVALELPYEILIKHFTASYSAARAALLEAWKFFKKRRQWMAENFCQPVYENWFDEAVLIGRISAPGYFTDPMMRKAYLGARWDGPGRGMIKEKEEAAAALLKVEGGLSTLEAEIVKLEGGDFDAILRQRTREKNKRIAAGLEEPIGGPPAPAVVPAPAEESKPDEEEMREELKNETD